MTKLTFITSVAALALASPVFAKNAAPAPKAEDEPAAACHSYRMAADGSWSVLPCHEAGQTEHKPSPKAGEQEPR